jgi:hypothetical protein
VRGTPTHISHTAVTAKCVAVEHAHGAAVSRRVFQLSDAAQRSTHLLNIQPLDINLGRNLFATMINAIVGCTAAAFGVCDEKAHAASLRLLSQTHNEPTANVAKRWQLERFLNEFVRNSSSSSSHRAFVCDLRAAGRARGENAVVV